METFVPLPTTIRKDQIVCAFHDDVDKDLCRMKKRLDILILITFLNVLLSGANIIFKIPTLF